MASIFSPKFQTEVPDLKFRTNPQAEKAVAIAEAAMENAAVAKAKLEEEARALAEAKVKLVHRSFDSQSVNFTDTWTFGRYLH